MEGFRRFVATLGLAGLGWIGYTLVLGDVSLFDAGLRAAAILAAVIVSSAVLRGGIGLLAASLDR